MLMIKVKDKVNLEELCKDWNDDGFNFELEGDFEAFCLINKKTRIIAQIGFTELINNWEKSEYLETV